VFALEMKDINRQDTLIKVGSKMFLIIVQHGTDSVVVVMPDDSGEGGLGGEKVHPKCLANGLMSVCEVQ
jgi:hypothetical protein